MIKNSIPWKFYNPTSIIFENGSLDKLDDYVPYKKVILITSSGFVRRGIVDLISKRLEKKIICILSDVKPNPDLLYLDCQLDRLRTLKPDAILALGGGSCIDSGKILSLMLSQPKEMTLKGHFRNNINLLKSQVLPIIAIPTTSGTGSEVTPFSTVWDFEFGKKYSVFDTRIFPSIAILDPTITYSLPEEITISSGLDAISHAFESIWNKKATPITMALSIESLSKSIPALRILKKSPDNKFARSELMLASLLAGLSISNTQTALAHSISYPLTAEFSLPHGIACSFSLPSVLKFNANSDDGRLANLAEKMNYSSINFMAEDIDKLLKDLNAYDIFYKYIPDLNLIKNLVSRMNNPSRSANNIRNVDESDISQILEDSLASFS